MWRWNPGIHAVQVGFMLSIPVCVGWWWCRKPVRECVHEYPVYGGQKSKSNPLELETQVVVSCLMLMLRTELRSLARAASNLSSVPHPLFQFLFWKRLKHV